MRAGEEEREDDAESPDLGSFAVVREFGKDFWSGECARSEKT
jgi:hypothetical protein